MITCDPGSLHFKCFEIDITGYTLYSNECILLEILKIIYIEQENFNLQSLLNLLVFLVHFHNPLEKLDVFYHGVVAPEAFLRRHN